MFFAEGFIDNRMTAFGETLSGSEGSASAEALRFFTGKPEVEGLGYAFLFRSYRPELGKWQTQDPIATVLLIPGGENLKVQSESLAELGYPDGWNNLAYCGNMPNYAIDQIGCYWNLVAGAVVGAVVGGVSGYITNGSLTATMAGTLGGAVGGAITAAGGGTLGTSVGSAIAAGITSFANSFASGQSQTQCLTNAGISAGVGAGLGTLTNYGSNIISDGITTLYGGGVAGLTQSIIDGTIAGAATNVQTAADAIINLLTTNAQSGTLNPIFVYE